jgi:hypothetical protein
MSFVFKAYITHGKRYHTTRDNFKIVLAYNFLSQLTCNKIIFDYLYQLDVIHKSKFTF